MKCIGKGNTAEVFEYAGNKALKLFYMNYPKFAVIREYQNATFVMKQNIPSPKVYEMMEWDHRYGILYERLYGKSMLEEIFAGGNIDELLPQMIQLHQLILSHESKEMISYKSFLHSIAYDHQDLMDKIDHLPDGDFLLHGDFHPGNVWMNVDGSIYVIDFMNVCRGPKEYDIARSYYLIGEARLPEDTPGLAKVKKMCRILANVYLKEMGYTFLEIEPYYEIIKAIREMNLE